VANSSVRELIAVKVLHTSLLNITVVKHNRSEMVVVLGPYEALPYYIHTYIYIHHCGRLKVLTLGRSAPMAAPSPPVKTILDLRLWKDLQSCRHITPDVINVVKMPSFQYFLNLREKNKVTGG
jgi:hypothetical protein